MAETKYGKLFIKEPFGKGGNFPVLTAYGETSFGGTDFSIRVHYQTEPYLMIKAPHKHDFDQYYCIMGGDLSNLQEFGAVIELCLGEEGEKHVIDTTTCIHIPKGLIHGPLEFVKIDKPVIMLDMLGAPKYSMAPM
jgi:hypothetical protein